MANQILPSVAFALCVFATRALAQPALSAPPPSRESEAGIPLLRNYTAKDYGFTQQFYAAVQGRNGVMYFAAGSVFMEYDGVTWRSFPIPGTNAVRAVAIDASDRIWVGASGNFGYLQSLANGTWQFISLLDKVPPEYQSFNLVFQVVSTPQGTFFEAAERIFRWDGKQMKVWPASTQFLSLAHIQGRIYTSQAGIGLQEIVGDELKSLPGGDAWKAPFALSILPYDDHRILIAAQNKLALYDGGETADFPTAADDYLKANLLIRATALPDGGFCLNTGRGGSAIIEHDGRLRRIVDQAAGLQGPSVLNAFTDREGALLLTLRGGVTRIEVNSPISVISRTNAFDVARYKGSLYISSLIGANSLFRLVPNRETGLPSLHPIPTPPTLVGGGLLTFEDATGKTQLLWRTPAGLMKIEGDTVAPALAGQPTDNQNVSLMLPSRKFPGRLYLAQGRGVRSVRWEGGKWRDEGRLPDPSGTIGTWAEEPDGTLWAGTQAGAVRIEPTSTGLLDAKSTLYSSKDGLEKGGLDVISAAGHIFLSSSSQDIRRWDKTTGKFVPDKRFFLPLKNSLFDAMRELPNGDIWVSNRSANEQRFGLHRRRPDGTFVLDEASFQRLPWSTIREVRSDPDGVLWFPTTDGLFRFDQRVKSTGQQTFSTLVRRVGSGADDIIFGGSTVADAAPIRLPYARNSLQFAFAAPVFGNETATVFRYRLEGGEANWSPWAKSTQANYSSLAPGNYRFRVQARDISGRLGEEGIYAFAIIPPWYRTWFAYSGYGLLFVLLTFAGRRRVIEREREKARLQTETLEHTVAERTKEIRLQADEISERAAELATINRISQALSGQLDMDRLIQLVGDQIREVFHASIAYVALLDRPTMMLHFPYTYGEEVPPRPFGEGLTSQIIRSGQPLLINEDLAGSSAKLGVRNIGRQAASYLGVPVPAGGEMIGVLSVQSAEEEGRFTEADQKLLSTIAASVGVAVHNARLFEEARQARAAAEQADEAKSTFLSTVSHELRTPLTSVLGFAKIIRKRLDERLFPLIPEDDKKIAAAKRQVTENLNVVVSEGERLTKLINDVLDLAKINAGKFTWNLGEVSMVEVIDRALAATSSLFESKKLTLVCQVDNDLPSITGDSDRLMQVVINLISNAVKFTESGTITCAATLRDNELIISVQDSGIGIRPEDQPRVFEKFKQVGDTLTDKPQGSGLGLPISKEIVEFHGGRIWVESEIDKGSTFFFSLPVKVKAAGAVSLPAAHGSVSRSMDFEALVRQLKENIAGHQPRPKSVLVVDDDPNIRSVLQQEFTEAGYPVRLAENGRQALAMIREEIPGLVILDVMMPEMNGFDVAAVLKNDPATMDIPIIILSIVEDKERGFRLGVDRYLTKPIDTDSLFREVGTLLHQGKSKKKVMVVDEDASTLRTLTDVLETRGYHVMESTGTELFSKAVAARPDIIVLSSLLSGTESVRSLRFEKGLENVLFLIYK